MQRELQQVIRAQATSDGAGVNIMRTLGQNRFARLDPFLMLDEFGSSEPSDYLAGFPSHPHRGFETVTYMLNGKMLHQDHLGNEGLLDSGDVQWMTAGRGIIHSEMPQQEEGLMRGFQLWINLPAAEKMKPAHYQDIKADEIPVITLGNNNCVKVIAGCVTHEGKTHQGPVQGVSTRPIYLDVHLSQGESFTQPIDTSHNVLLYVYEGELLVGDTKRHLGLQQLGILHKGDEIRVTAHKPDTRFLLIGAQPIGEPVVQYGPFVMNTVEEVEQAIRDFQNGTLAESP